MRRITLLPLAAALAAAGCATPEPEIPVALFTRHYLQPIYQEDIPAPEEIGAPIVMQATPGEYEPAAVGVRAQHPLREVRLVPGDLTGPGGARIAAEEFDVRITGYGPPLRRWRPIKRHPHPPKFLEPRTSVDLPARQTQQFWITLHVPEDAEAGEYRGELTLRAAGEPDLGVPLSLTVHPFRLGKAGPAYFLYGDNYPLSAEKFDESRRHGMNTICTSHGWAKNVLPTWNGEAFVYEDRFSALAEVVELARSRGLAVDRPLGVMLYSHLMQSLPVALSKAGVRSPDGELLRALDQHRGYELFWPRGRAIEVEKHRGPYYPARDPAAPPRTRYGKILYEGWKTAMRELDALGRERGWPPIWYYLIDEPHHSRGAMRLAIMMARAASEANADGMMTCNEPTVSEPDESKLWFPAVDGEPGLRLEPFLKTRCYHNRYLGPETRQRTREAGDHYGTYVNIYGNQPASTRYMTGYLAWRLDLELVMLWQWKNASTEFGEGRAWLRDWEAAREGIDDIRYIEALERAIDAGGGDPGAREAARALIDRLRREIVPSVKEIGYVDGVTGRWVPGKRAWAPERYDEIRREVAQAIARLGGDR